jgi:hypothetical protein
MAEINTVADLLRKHAEMRGQQIAFVTGVGSIIFNWLSCINEYHKLRERNKR